MDSDSISTPANHDATIATVKRLTCVFAPLNAWGHICVCISIAEVLQTQHKVNIVFIINQTWKNKLTPLGFREEIYYKNGINKCLATSPSQYWTDLVGRLGPIMKLSSFDKISTFGLQAQQQMCSEVRASNSEVEQILIRIKPDVIVTDNYVLTPALVRQNIPWIRLRSASPLEINPTDAIPPYNSGYSVDDESGWEAFTKEQDDVHKDLWTDFSKWFCDETNGQFKLPTGQFILDSPILNLYVYPQELDYTVLRPMPNSWVRLDALITQRPNKTSFEVPNEFLESAKFSKRSLIYVSLGTFGSADLNVIKNIIQILSQTEYYCIVVKGPFHDQYEFPSLKFWGAQTLPQTEILPLIDIVICHGGNSTINECFYFGKPMVVLPIFGDEYDNAQRIHEMGYGVRLDPYNLSKEQLLSAIEKINGDPDVKSRMLAASKRIQSVEGGGASVAANLIMKHGLGN